MLIREGAEGGSWDLIEERWTFSRWAAMRRQFEIGGPPIAKSLSVLAGIELKPTGGARPSSSGGSGGGPIQDPYELAQSLASLGIPGGTVNVG